MGLGGTAKKLQKVVDAAEQLYSKMNEVIGEIGDLREQLEATSEQVDRMERELAEQRALVEALAEQEGVDAEAALDGITYPEPPAVATDDEEASSGDSDNAE
jgi:septal ring factor EnvC (AmiA/AmiB activator)